MSDLPYNSLRLITFVRLPRRRRAPSLVHATFSQEHRTMKRFAIVAALAALTVVACKKKEEAPAAAPEATEPAAKPAEGDKPAEPAAAPAAAATDPAAAAAPAAATDPAAAPAAAGDAESTGIAECDALVKRYTSCDKLPAEQKAAFMEGAKAWKQGAASGNDQVKASIADSCKKAMTSAEESMKAIGC
jgi:hypothetical protein